MAAAPITQAKGRKVSLRPFYIGLTTGKDLKGKPYTHTHYVLIESLVAEQLGIKNKSIIKPGSDAGVDGVVIQTNHKKSRGDKKPYEAKRYLQRCKKKITVICKGTVKNKQNKDVQETYSIGFPSNVPIRLIRKFFEKYAPNVIRIGTGGNLYQVR
jgi:hypothetical protein